MVYISDYISLGTIFIISLFYFTNDHVQSVSRKIFSTCLILSASTAALDILTCYLSETPGGYLGFELLMNSLYFVVNILTTSAFAIFLIYKILEHVYERHCMKKGIIALSIVLGVYLIFVVINLFTGWLFYFDEDVNYVRGPLNAIGYVTTAVQMLLVVICYFRNKKSTDRKMKRALLYTFPAIIFAIALQLIYINVMLNGTIMAYVALSLFLNFKSTASGVSSITKLNNRLVFFQDVEAKINSNQSIQVLLITLKSYSLVNQKYGYKIGDEILYRFSVLLEEEIKNANCFHIHGTSFALIFNYTDDKTAKQNLINVQEYLDGGLIFHNEKISGKYIIVEYFSKADEGNGNAKELYERLKYASSLAGKSGRSYIRYTDDIGSEMLRRRYIIDRLETIDREHGYEIWLQPIFCLRNSKFCSSEALIRLREPDGKLISPGEFIPIAEQTGDINKITWFVVEEVCAYLEAHPDIRIAVSINLPMAQMLEEDFEEKFNRIVDGHGIAHRQICIEFTERSIYKDYEQLKAKMNSLTKQGYRFYLDDFGSGYSNFSCLLKLPFEIIKLDANITNTILTENSSNELVSMLTKLFHSMNLTVVAEGVENERLVEALRDRDIDRIQGYYYAKPMKLSEITEFYSDKIL